MTDLSLVDLFCGAGGTTRGFLDRERWSTIPTSIHAVGAVDIDSSALETYVHNFPGVPAVRADLTALGFEEIRALMRRFGVRTGRLDILVASPPCQTYSRNNRARRLDDQRNWLYEPVLNWIRMLRPKAVVLENVDHLKETDEGLHDRAIRRGLAALNYQIGAWELDAVQYGVPQHRLRRFYLAYRADLAIVPEAPPATHHAPGLGRTPLWVTASKAIDDLPRIERAGDGRNWFVSKADPSLASFIRRHGSYAAMMRPAKGSCVSHHTTPSLSQLALMRLSNLEAGQAMSKLPTHLQPRMGFRSAYGRIHPDRPAWTITANCDYVSRGRFSHYQLNRGLSMREAARLQSFPDEFHFIGCREAVARQIGNAVPPLLARAFALEVSSKLLRAATQETSADVELSAMAG